VREPPSGTVTLLFTDIEGSTRLLTRLGERYAGLLEDHHRLLREAITANAGYEVDSEGDAFFVAFARAGTRLRCAAQAQWALESHSWPEGLPVRVRMGLHTGESLVSSGRCIGLDVHRAARVMSSGHGGRCWSASRRRSSCVRSCARKCLAT
jgi:class 3 adenylate cyclase